MSYYERVPFNTPRGYLDCRNNQLGTERLRTSQNKREPFLVSVVVPTKNSGNEIRRCLDSIKLQDYSKIEIIVIDNESRDKTREISEEYGAKVVNTDSKRSQARNIGAKISKGEFILFVDSDQELDKELISKAVGATTINNLDAVRFPKIIRGESFFGKVRSVESWLNYRDGRTGGAPRFLKKSTFLKMEGYDEELTFGEDRELLERLNSSKCRVGILDVPVFEVDNSIKKRLIKNYNYGKHYAKYQRKVSRASTVLFESVNLKCVRNVSSISELFYSFFAIVFKVFNTTAFIIGRIIGT